MTGARRDRLRLPGFWRRWLAGAIDTSGGVLLSGAAVAGGWIDVSAWTATRSGYLWIESASMALAARPVEAFGAVVQLGLGLVAWHAAWGIAATRTPGEWLARIEVIDATGLRAGRARLAVRAAAYASWGASLGLAAGAPWISRTQRGVPDMVARTWVVAIDGAAPRAPAVGSTKRGA